MNLFHGIIDVFIGLSLKLINYFSRFAHRTDVSVTCTGSHVYYNRDRSSILNRDRSQTFVADTKALKL